MDKEVDLPCLICGDDVASLATDDKITVKTQNFVDLRARICGKNDHSKLSDDIVFQWFLKLFHVNSDEESNQEDFNVNGEEDSSFRFCGSCKSQLGTLMELKNRIDELKNKITAQVVILMGKMERFEGSLQSEEIYKCYPRYKRVRRKIFGKG